ncbi:TfoX/Sxy family DNA transformation protein [Vibrio agarivorans]|uniref:TfoX/Sxy family DNA transformation protein n=1 Tax=Vibrio agarivorans TaxID=153622 RepID=A0ABT7Y746_9VIBR|nr:TfoX/Sxy family DNA transformation protein [Vibrio agarivorans]MDN2483877.1 TfoX/Sxy family DNA transformation protein [Vibrio agarivorans]
MNTSIHDDFVRDTIEIVNRAVGKQVDVKQAFGTAAIHVDGIYFASIQNELLHIRSGNEDKELFEKLGWEKRTYQKKHIQVTTGYYTVPSQYLRPQSELLRDLINQSYLSACKDRENQTIEKTERVKDLPNLSLKIERMFKKAGITTVEQLRLAGSVYAYLRLNIDNPEILWRIEGALRGVHYSTLSIEERQLLSAKAQQATWW